MGRLDQTVIIVMMMFGTKLVIGRMEILIPTTGTDDKGNPVQKRNIYIFK